MNHFKLIHFPNFLFRCRGLAKSQESFIFGSGSLILNILLNLYKDSNLIWRIQIAGGKCGGK